MYCNSALEEDKVDFDEFSFDYIKPDDINGTNLVLIPTLTDV